MYKSWSWLINMVSQIVLSDQLICPVLSSWIGTKHHRFSNIAVFLIYGPPIMIKFVLQNLDKLGFKDEQIYTTLERRMKCGIGKCGRCNINHIYVCKDGPVFSLKELRAYPEVFE